MITPIAHKSILGLEIKEDPEATSGGMYLIVPALTFSLIFPE
jgi:hypothetical protein